MKAITLSQPSQVTIGHGCAAQCGELLQREGVSRTLLVSSSNINTDCVRQSLTASGCEVVNCPAVNAEPTVAMFEQALAAAERVDVQAVVALGGGSVMDVAKLLAVLIPGDQPVRELFGIGLVRSRGLFSVCLPTTAGTGSEVSPNAILLDEADQLKKGVISPYLVPDVALVDPLLTLSVPPAVTAATGMDALTHCLEAYTNRYAHPVVDLYALQGIRLISANLLCAVEDGADAEARAQLALGSLYGGLCLGPVNTAAVHALAYPLGGQFSVAHGVSNAVLLPHVTRFNLDSAVERHCDIAVALGVEPASTPRETAERGVDRLVELSRACGVPQRLSELGIPRAAIRDLTQGAMQVTRLLKNNPRELTEGDAIRIYEAAY